MTIDEPDPFGPGEAPCEYCGDRAYWAPKVQGVDHPMPVCDTCAHDKVTDCERCGAFFLMADGYRVHAHAPMTCPECMKDTPQLIAGLKRDQTHRDEQDDQFNRTRR